MNHNIRREGYGMKEKVQVFGRFLSGMVMPNIGGFIAWGIITALFIGTGWFPNEKLVVLVDPLLKYMLPILIAYTGGKNVAGAKGGVVGVIAAMGVIVGAGIPMFLGAMIMGPFGGWVIKQYDKLIAGKVKAGFEMLVDNFSVGIIGTILAIIGLIVIGPVVESLNVALAAGVGVFVDNNLLPLSSILIEPAKVLFLNNAINHGILTPLGIKEAEEVGRSIFFLLEANPGPGLGILLAYCLLGKGSAKGSAPGAVIIHFFGGIHEIYFPYILMNPALLISAIAGGASGVFILNLFGGGLIGPASPGSIIAILAMTPKGGYLPIILSVIVATVVSFVISMPILKFFGKEEDLSTAKSKVNDMKRTSKGLEREVAMTNDLGPVRKIIFACDAGMGSSAMGATVLRKKITEAGLGNITVEHASVSSIPEDAQVVVTHFELKERAANSNPKAKLVLIKNFLSAPEYDQLVEELKQSR